MSHGITHEFKPSIIKNVSYVARMAQLPKPGISSVPSKFFPQLKMYLPNWIITFATLLP